MAAPAPRADASDAVAAAPRSAAAAFALRTTDWEHALLACDFASSDRPALVTALLSAFLTKSDGAPVEPIELWNLAVSTRHLSLVRIVAMLENTGALALRLRCPQAECRELSEIPLSLVDLAAFHHENASGEILTLPCGENNPVSLRRPTGDDLRRWHAGVPATDEASVYQAMLRDLVLSGEAPADPAPLAGALESFDPLLAFTLAAACPACGHSADHQIDFEAITLERLRAHQGRLFQEIHLIARAYGWTESGILALPAVRRARYLELIDAASSP